MRFERNRPCPCGSGAKFKRCCGRDRETQRVLEARLSAMAEIMALATMTPRLRPESAGFDAWAARVGIVADHPLEELLDAGIAALGTDERRRLVDACAELCGRAWDSVREDLGDDAQAELLFLRGAVLAGLHEREPIAAPLFTAVELHREVCDNPVCALATVLDPSDLWSLVEAAEIDEAAEGDPDEAADLGRWRWTPDHARRLEVVLGRLRSELPAAPPVARQALEEACDAVARDPVLGAEVGAVLLDHALDLLDSIASAA
jgi:hypothetical protein